MNRHTRTVLAIQLHQVRGEVLAATPQDLPDTLDDLFEVIADALGQEAPGFERGDWTETVRTGTPPRRRVNSVATDARLSDAETDLFKRLKAFRTAEAARRKVAPFMIFHDKALIPIARAQPTTHAALLMVPGIGPAKLDDFGDQIIAIVEAWANGLPNPVEPYVPPTPPPAPDWAVNVGEADSLARRIRTGSDIGRTNMIYTDDEIAELRTQLLALIDTIPPEHHHLLDPDTRALIDTLRGDPQP